MGLDVGPRTVEAFARRRSRARGPSCGTVRWGCSSWSRSPQAPGGWRRPSPAAAAFTVVGGGDSARRAARARPRRRGGSSVHRRRRVAGVHRRPATCPASRCSWRGTSSDGGSRRPIIAANWKMHKTHLEAIQVVQKLSYLLDKKDSERVEVVICPPFTALRSVQTLLEGDRLPTTGSARRTCHCEAQGAFTGEVSPAMLAALKVRLRDRRSLRAAAAVRRDRRDRSPRRCGRSSRDGMTPILCVGETLEERDAGRTEDKVAGPGPTRRSRA